MALLEARADDFDVVLLDLILPRQSGAAVFRRLKSLRSDLPVVLSSGNVSEGLSDPQIREGVAAVLPKPYLPVDLVRIVRRVLSNQPVP